MTRRSTAAPPPAAPPAPPASRTSARFTRWLWLVGLALALALLAVDSVRRLDGLDGTNEAAVGSRMRPEAEPASPSGFRFGEHRLVLTQVDGYEWLLEAEQELTGGGARVRHVDFDDAPSGREVHWAGFMRWWGIGVAKVYGLFRSDLTAVQALERVAPWANTALLVLALLALTPLIARRFGWLGGGLFALGCVAVYPFYDFFGVGYFDHHGVASLACLLMVLFLVAGGGGWVRPVAPAKGDAPDQRALAAWLPTRGEAVRWMIASGIVSGAGLWISAAAMAPVLAATGLAVLVSFAVARPGRSPWTLDPGLFRAWGIAGGASSLAFYLLEYFPSHLGMRLEVNHPLYALALGAGGDLLARVGERVVATPVDSAADSGRGRAGWIAVDLALVLALPVIALGTGAATFRLGDRALWLLHTRSIVEFLPLQTWMATRTPAQVAGQMSLIPLLGLLVTATAWSADLGGRRRAVWRAALIVVAGASAAYAYVFFFSLTRGSVVVAIVGTLAALGLWLALPLSPRSAPLAAPWQALLMIAAGPAVILLLVALLQMRWWGGATALWVGVAVVTAAVVVRAGHPATTSASGRLAWGTLAIAVYALAPAFFAREPFTRPNADVVVRDAALWLRRRVGNDAGVLFAAPTPTTQMIWFGGFRGIGTLYWENLEGLRAATAIYAQPNADSTRAMLQRAGVSHIVFFGWDPGLEWLEFSAAMASGTEGAEPAGYLHRLELEIRAGESVTLPPWLEPLPYAPATVAGYHHPVVQILEVVPDQPGELALVRLAQFYQATQNATALEAALKESLAHGPTVPALALLAQLQQAQGDRDGMLRTADQLRGELARARELDLADRVEAAVALGVAQDRAGITRELATVLARADERQLRRIPPERLALVIEVSRQLGLDRTYPQAIALAQSLIPPS